MMAMPVNRYIMVSNPPTNFDNPASIPYSLACTAEKSLPESPQDIPNITISTPNPIPDLISVFGSPIEFTIGNTMAAIAASIVKPYDKYNAISIESII